MMLAEQAQLTDDVALVRAEGRADIVHRQAGQPAHEPVRGPRRPAARDAFAPVRPPAAHDVVAFLDPLEKRRDVFGKMLQVGVHRNDDVAFRMVEADLQRGSLSVVAPQRNHLHAPVDGREFLGCFEGPIAAAIVDENEFEDVAPAQRARHLIQPLHERGKGGRLVVDGQHDAHELPWNHLILQDL